MEENERCVTCKFWEHYSTDDYDNKLGLCLRYPPVYTSEKHSPETLGFDFPTVDGMDWCGEWKPIPLPISTPNPAPMPEPEGPTP